MWWLTLARRDHLGAGASLACQNVATRMGTAWAMPACCHGGSARFHRRARPDQRRHRAAYPGIGRTRLRRARGAWAARGPFFIFLIAFVLVLGVIFVYVAANIGLMVYFMTKGAQRVQRDQAFHLPGGHQPGALYSIYAAFVPLPAAPNNWIRWSRRSGWHRRRHHRLEENDG